MNYSENKIYDAYPAHFSQPPPPLDILQVRQLNGLDGRAEGGEDGRAKGGEDGRARELLFLSTREGSRIRECIEEYEGGGIKVVVFTHHKLPGYFSSLLFYSFIFILLPLLTHVDFLFYFFIYILPSFILFFYIYPAFIALL